MEEEQNKSQLKKILTSKITLGIVAALVVIPITIAGFAQVQRNEVNNTPEEVLAANEADEIIKSVGMLMDLPDEEPTVATVSDVEKLKDQDFFSRAQNGDKVIIFPKAQKAILYRPATDKIIEVALYTPPAEDTQSTQPQVAEPTPRSLQDLIGEDDVTPTPTPGTSTTPTPTIEEENTSPTPTGIQ